jgi:hypothetical protein
LFYTQLQLTNPSVKCKIPIPIGSQLTQLPISYSAKCKSLIVPTYQLPVTFTVECQCPGGTVWDEECQDCVPVCFPDVLAMVQIINAKLPAKIIG